MISLTAPPHLSTCPDSSKVMEVPDWLTPSVCCSHREALQPVQRGVRGRGAMAGQEEKESAEAQGLRLRLLPGCDRGGRCHRRAGGSGVGGKGTDREGSDSGAREASGEAKRRKTKGPQACQAVRRRAAGGGASPANSPPAAVNSLP
eukprot:918614-Prorocentrum_minimum.AAC.1